jgi:hypothetical protein
MPPLRFQQDAAPRNSKSSVKKYRAQALPFTARIISQFNLNPKRNVMSPHLKQILCGLICISTFALAGCGSSGPSEKQCATQLDQMFRGLFSAESLDLQKTGQEGNISVYSVSGKFELNQNLFIPVAQVGDKTVLKRTTEKGLETPFSATLTARGTDNTGWVLSFSDLTFDRSQFKGSVADADIAHDPSHYLKVGDSDFEAQIKKLTAGCKKYLPKGSTTFVAPDDASATIKNEKTQIDDLAKARDNELSQDSKNYQKQKDDYYRNVYVKEHDRIQNEWSKKRGALYGIQNNQIKKLYWKVADAKTFGQSQVKFNGKTMSVQQAAKLHDQMQADVDARNKEGFAEFQKENKDNEAKFKDAQNKMRQDFEQEQNTARNKYNTQIRAIQAKLDTAEDAQNKENLAASRCQRMVDQVIDLGLKGYLK